MENLSQSMFFSALVLAGSFALLVFLTYKGIGKVFAPLICAIVLSMVALDGFEKSMFTLFPAGAASFLQRIMLPSITGTLFGEAMAYSGAGHAIGQYVTKKIGKDNAPYVILLSTVLVMLSGMNMAVFTIAALSHSLMKEANLPSYIGMVCYFGVSDLTVFCMPGIPHNANLLPTTYLGTDLYAGFWPGIIGTLAGYVFVFLYVKHLVKQARERNIGYEGKFAEESKSENEQTKHVYPPFVKAIVPLIIVIGLAFVLQKGFKISASIAVFISQITAFLTLLLLCKKNFTKKIIDIVRSSAENVGSFLFTCGCMVGYAGIVSNTLAYQKIVEGLSTMDINPYVFTVLAVAVIAGVTAECNTGEILFLESFAGKLLTNPAVNPGVIHRLTTMTATAFDSMPHGGFVLLTLELFGYDHKKGYKYVFMSAIVVPLISTMVGLIISLIFY